MNNVQTQVVIVRQEAGGCLQGCGQVGCLILVLALLYMVMAPFCSR